MSLKDKCLVLDKMVQTALCIKSHHEEYIKNEYNFKIRVT